MSYCQVTGEPVVKYYQNILMYLAIPLFSLGAAIASIALYMLQQKINLPSNFPTPTSYAYFGYGEPRVGNKAYADYFNSQKKVQITRIVNKAGIKRHSGKTFHTF